ncbi:MAG: hypothetical protein L6Q47_15115 [Ignavibacteriaceae bacterium]|nr:hypothetical protein [Ignavibacteriaceae bacterium]
MKLYTPPQEVSKILQRLKQQAGMISEDDTLIILYDFAMIRERMESVQKAFPSGSLHTAAVKANPLVRILQKAIDQGFGLEAASRGELALSESAGAPASKIVFDSPAKTIQEIRHALEMGIYLNTDSFAEIDRVAALAEEFPIKAGVGVRVNPQVGMGAISSTSVAGQISKFGIPLQEREKLKEYYLKFSFLNGIHLHIGSQGCPLEMLVQGVKKAADFAEEVNNHPQFKNKQQRITHFDLGGGLPVGYHHQHKPVTLENYTELLRKEVPVLFSGKYRLITEFGRYLYANAGTVITRIEYVKNFTDARIIMNHAGADLFLRKSYHPDDWHHEIALMDASGTIKSGRKKQSYMIAGPLCFAGDIIERNVILPEAEEGDYLIIHDAGAYNLSAWSRYNSRQIPLVIGYHPLSEEVEVLRKRETLQDIVSFWS